MITTLYLLVFQVVRGEKNQSKNYVDFFWGGQMVWDVGKNVTESIILLSIYIF